MQMPISNSSVYKSKWFCMACVYTNKLSDALFLQNTDYRESTSANMYAFAITGTPGKLILACSLTMP